MEGILGGKQGIYFDGTPVENGDGSQNFGDFGWDFRAGASFQDHMTAFGDYVGSETSVGSEVKFNLPVTKTIVNPNLDAIEVRLGFVLQLQTDKGDLKGNSIAYRIEVKQGAGAFENRWEQTLSGVYSSLVEFPFRFPVDNQSGTVSQFTVRVTRLTPKAEKEDSDIKVLNFQAYGELSFQRLTYKHSAVVGLRFDASIFDSIPEITFKMALRKVLIPSNATIAVDRGLNYSGVWNGSFAQGTIATSDPLWCLYDLLTNSVYGLGRYLGIAPPNKWLFYELSQYANAMVSDGKGGSERRYSCNVVLQDRRDALEVVRAWLSIFRGIAYYNGATIAIAADKPDAPVMQFTQSDVVEGNFDYARSGLKTRHSVASVTWNDPEQLYERRVTFVEDKEALEVYGYRLLEMAAFGCTSEGQARRAGLAALLTDRIESETVTFEARAYAAACRPGQVIQISDRRVALASVSGLLKSGSSASLLLLDRPHGFSDSEPQQITITLASGAIESRDVNEVASSLESIVPVSAFSEEPTAGANWVVSTFDVQPQLFRVMAVEPKPETNYSIFKITAIEHRPDKEAAIEQGAALQPRSLTKIGGDRALPPLSASLVASAPPKQLALTWVEPVRDGARDPFAAAYQLELREDENPWLPMSLARTNSLIYSANLKAGTSYQFRVATLDVTGKQSEWVYSNTALVPLPPSPIELRISDRQYRFIGGEAGMSEVLAFSDPPNYGSIESFEVERTNIPNSFLLSNPYFSSAEVSARSHQFTPQRPPYYNYYRVRLKNREGDFSPWSSLLFSSLHNIAFDVFINGHPERLQLAGLRLEAFKTIQWFVNGIAFRGASQLSYRRDDGEWIEAGFDQATFKDLGPLQPGTYDFRVRLQNQYEEISKWFYLSSIVEGKSKSPGPVEGLTLALTSDRMGRLNWDETKDEDVRIGGFVEIRFLPSVLSLPVSKADRWNAAEPVARIPGGSASWPVQISSGSFLVRFEDTAEPPNLSLETASVSMNDFGFLSENIVLEISEGPAWGGVLEGFAPLPAGAGIRTAEIFGWSNVDENWDTVDINWPDYSPLAQVERSLPVRSSYSFRESLSLPGDVLVNISSTVEHTSVPLIAGDKPMPSPIVPTWFYYQVNGNWVGSAATPVSSDFPIADSIVQASEDAIKIRGSAWVAFPVETPLSSFVLFSSANQAQGISFEAKLNEVEDARLIAISMARISSYASQENYTLQRIAGTEAIGTLVTPRKIVDGWGYYECSLRGQTTTNARRLGRTTIAAIAQTGKTVDVEFRNIRIVSAPVAYQLREDATSEGTAIAKLEIRQFASNVWDDWRPLVSGPYFLQKALFRLVSFSLGSRDTVANAKVICDVPDRRHRQVLKTSPLGFTKVFFAPPYNRAPIAVAIIIQNGSAGDLAIYSDLNADSVLVGVKSGSAFVSRTIDLQVESY